jgi:ABC-type antimicrobial peptide transport system permease subunit
MRRTLKLIRVALNDLGRRKARSFLTVAAVTVGAAAIFVALSMSGALESLVVGQLSSDLSLTEIVVTPKSYSLGPLSFQDQMTSLDSDALSRISSMSGVVSVSRQQSLKFPASLSASLFGQSLKTDTGVYGVDEGWLEEKATGGYDFSSRELDEPVPVVLSSKLVDMYNIGFAEGSGLPRLDEDAIVGRRLYLDLGVSSFVSKQGTILESVRGRIVGTSNRVSIMGVTVPIGWVEYWNRVLGDPDANKEYSSLIVKVESAEVLPGIMEEISQMGFAARAGLDLARKVSSSLRFLTVASYLLGITLFILVGVALSFALFLNVREGKTKIAVYRALGARRRDIREIFLSQAFVLGLAGSIFGLAVGAVVVAVIRSNLLTRLYAFAPEIETALGFSWSAAVVSLVFTILCSFVAGIVPAARAASSSPVDILRTI